VALILVLNVVVLAMSDLVHNLRAQRRLAELRLVELGQAYNILTETNELRDQMVQNISHELRTPLSMVIGYSELLESGTWGELSAEQKEAAHVIWKNGRRLSEIVEKVTVLDQVGVGQMTHHPTSLNALLRTSINAWQETLLDNYTLRLQMPEKTLNLSGDVQYLRLAIDALLDNALKFSPEGGEITIKLWNEEGKIYLVVKDQGIVISEQYQAHLFERFYQVDGSTTRQFGGLGTGLALVKAVAVAHGGGTWVKSELGKGSTFGFWIPDSHQFQQQVT
ncbi:MAG: HAMP domain-containing histidine kinase, partial [Anaerolineae bacterium]|nr:HAMP domain-containing histidine kinase [Anaerolineae bacterium]